MISKFPLEFFAALTNTALQNMTERRQTRSTRSVQATLAVPTSARRTSLPCKHRPDGAPTHASGDVTNDAIDAIDAIRPRSHSGSDANDANGATYSVRRGLNDERDERRASRGLMTETDQSQVTPPRRQSQSYITSQFEPTSRASHALMQLRDKGDKKVGMEVCAGAWTGGRYGLLFEDEGKRKKRDWESSSGEEDESEGEEEHAREEEGTEAVAKAARVHVEANVADVAEAPVTVLDDTPAHALDNNITASAPEHVPETEAPADDPPLPVPLSPSSSLPEPFPVETEPDEIKQQAPASVAAAMQTEDQEYFDDIEIELDDFDMDEETGPEDNDDASADNDDADNDLNNQTNNNPDVETTDKENDGMGMAKARDFGPLLAVESTKCRVTMATAQLRRTASSPQSLSLCTLPQAVETKPSQELDMSIPHIQDTKNAKDAMDTTPTMTPAVVSATPAIPAAFPPVTWDDRLAQAIVGHQSEAAIRSMLSEAAKERVTDDAPCRTASRMPPPLLCACMEDSVRNTSIVGMLLEHKADVNESHREDGFTPLMQSVKTGNLTMIRFLLEAGADLSCTCKDGRSALFVAIDMGKTAAARCILGTMFDANISVDVPRLGNGRTALMEAARRGQGDVVAALVQAGANLDLVDEDQRTALMLGVNGGVSSKKTVGLLVSKTSVNLPDAAGVLPLEVAISMRLAPVAEMIVDDGRYDISNMFSKSTPLIHAIVNQGGTRLVRKMLDRGADPDAEVGGKTALMHAAEIGASQIIFDLIKASANPFKEQEGGEGWTALMFAARHGHAAASQVLMTAMGIRPPEGKNMVVSTK